MKRDKTIDPVLWPVRRKRWTQTGSHGWVEQTRWALTCLASDVIYLNNNILSHVLPSWAVTAASLSIYCSIKKIKNCFSSPVKEAFFSEISLKELWVALLLAHCKVYLGRFNKLSTYQFNPARAWKSVSEMNHQAVAWSNIGVDVYSIRSGCFLLLTGRGWF